jgi:hypothetical protein
MPASFKLEVLGRYQARHSGNENAVTVNMQASNDEEHFVYAGTITMTESQFETFVKGLRAGLDGRVDVEDRP